MGIRDGIIIVEKNLSTSVSINLEKLDSINLKTIKRTIGLDYFAIEI